MGGCFRLLDPAAPDVGIESYDYRYGGLLALKGSFLRAIIEHIQTLLDKPNASIQTYITEGVDLAPDAEVHQARKILTEALGVAKGWVREPAGGDPYENQMLSMMLGFGGNRASMLPEDMMNMNFRTSITEKLTSPPKSFQLAGVQGLYHIMKLGDSWGQKVYQDEAQKIVQAVDKALVFMDEPKIVEMGLKEMATEMGDFVGKCTGNLYVEL